MASTNDIVVITGASRGIGAACARQAGAAGYRVAMMCRSGELGNAVRAEIETAGGVAQVFGVDIRSEASILDAFRQLDDWGGKLSGVINNAGISGGRHSFLSLPPEVLNETLNTNLTGTVYCCREAAKRMARSAGGNGGAIVNISSTAAESGGFRLAHYALSKGGMNALTKSLAIELGEEDIRVNCLSPGVIQTEQQPLDDADWVKKTRARIPLGRLGTPKDVAKAALWLLSEDASYISGANIRISGGL